MKATEIHRESRSIGERRCCCCCFGDCYLALMQMSQERTVITRGLNAIGAADGPQQRNSTEMLDVPSRRRYGQAVDRLAAANYLSSRTSGHVGHGKVAETLAPDGAKRQSWQQPQQGGGWCLRNKARLLSSSCSQYIFLRSCL